MKYALPKKKRHKIEYFLIFFGIEEKFLYFCHRIPVKEEN